MNVREGLKRVGSGTQGTADDWVWLGEVGRRVETFTKG